MATNKIKDHLVTVEYLNESVKGSGVITASHDRSDYYYILTARHNFTDKLATSDEIKNEDLCIKLQDKVRVTPENLKVYFLDKKYDLALIIFKLKRSSNIDNLKSLKIYNSDTEEDRKSIFSLAGYPDWLAKEDLDANHDLIPAYTIDYNEDTCAEVLKDKGASTTHAIRYEKDHYTGISGGGVFFEDQYKNLQLRSIIKQYSSGSFSCKYPTINSVAKYHLFIPSEGSDFEIRQPTDPAGQRGAHTRLSDPYESSCPAAISGYFAEQSRIQNS